MRLLLVEDDRLIREAVVRGLEEQRAYAVDTAADGQTGLRLALEGAYALIILDLMLPGLDGWRLCQELRARRNLTPLLMLTARDTVADLVRGFELGADDYLAKPFEFDELLARVRALLRRDKIHKTRLLRVGHVEIDTATLQVTRAGEVVNLTPREYALLEALALNEGRVLTRDLIQERVWTNEECTSNTVDVFVGMLRRKLEGPDTEKLIHTVHGLGYMLKSPPSRERWS